MTGASRGIGRACAVALAGAGFDVAASARTLVDGTATLDDGVTPLPGGLDTTVAAIEAAGQEGLAVEMDLLDRESVLACADRVVEHFGRVDVLVNNAIYQGPGAMVPISELGPEHLLPIFEGKQREPHKEIYWRFNKANAVRQGNMKVIRAGKSWELYDLKADPTETNNLAKKHPDKTRELAAMWEQWNAGSVGKQ